jgi:lipoic acid synthetase
LVLGGELPKSIPDWLKSDLPDTSALGNVVGTISSLRLNTICFEARCPNKPECFSRSSVTFLLLGRFCSRRCAFCNVEGAKPEPVDPDEPRRIREACVKLGLDHVILTSVTRDDLEDGGSSHFAGCVRALKRDGYRPSVEVLVPDFGGDLDAVERVVVEGPDVFGHNVETVERLYPVVRDRASYTRTLGILEHVSSNRTSSITKSGLMLGLGESPKEVKSTLRDLSGAGCRIVSVGQYMRPSKKHLPVAEYVHPDVFDEVALYARELGLTAVCGPRVRSSYQARATFHEARSRRQKCA